MQDFIRRDWLMGFWGWRCTDLWPIGVRASGAFATCGEESPFLDGLLFKLLLDIKANVKIMTKPWVGFCHITRNQMTSVLFYQSSTDV